MSAPNSSKSPSTFDLLRWSDAPVQTSPHTPLRPQPTGGISSILLGAALTPEEAEALQKKKPNSDLKKREMSGSGIFSQDAGHDVIEKPTVRVHQPAGGISQISFNTEDSIMPKKPTSVPEVAKQRELSGTLEIATDETLPSRKPTSTAKVRELVGNNIFAPPPDIQPKVIVQSLESADASTPVSNPSSKSSKFPGAHLASFGQEEELSSKKLNTHKVAELSGNNIFKDNTPPSVPEKPLSAAKRKEITGNDIFADEKPVIRDHLGGIRKPPGGESSLTLV